MDDISTDELKAAWQRSGIWRCGISYQKAIDTPILLRSMRCQIIAHRRATQQRPKQAALELEAA